MIRAVCDECGQQEILGTDRWPVTHAKPLGWIEESSNQFCGVNCTDHNKERAQFKNLKAVIKDIVFRNGSDSTLSLTDNEMTVFKLFAED